MKGGECHIMRQVYPNELMHYGILGQKWGIRRYQNPDGTLTEAGKRRYGTVENLESGRTKRQAQKYEAEKKAAIRSGSVKEISKYSKDLTSEEFQEAVGRINMEHKLADLNNQELAIGQRRLEGALKKGQTLGDLYNMNAKIFNAFSKNKKLPIIGLSLDDQKKKYDLERTKEKDKEADEFEAFLKKHDQEYFQKHADKFTDDQLKRVAQREMYKNQVENKGILVKDTGKSEGDSNKNSSKQNAEKKSSSESKSDKSSESTKEEPGKRSRNSILNRMVNDTSTARQDRNATMNQIRQNRTDSLEDRVNSFLDTKTVGDRFNDLASEADDWVRRKYGV